MVDVGYCINGKHGVIWSVIPISNTKTEHLCFIKANGEEQYALKKEDIEYVIPHEEEYKWYTEEQMIALCQSVDKPLTNAEKFKEVFGFEPDRSECNMCDIMDCVDKIDSCKYCPYQNNDWDAPYVKAEVKN